MSADVLKRFDKSEIHELEASVSSKEKSDYAIARANSAYRVYLKCLFNVKYFQSRNEALIKRSQQLDFVIACSAILTGTSGISAFVLNESIVAWMTGALTLGTAILSAGRTAFQWPEKLRCTLETLTTLSPICGKARHLVDDIQAARAWTEDFENTFCELRQELENVPVFPFENWSAERLRSIQDQVKYQTDYQNWWSFQK